MYECICKDMLVKDCTSYIDYLCLNHIIVIIIVYTSLILPPFPGKRRIYDQVPQKPGHISTRFLSTKTQLCE